MIFLIMFFVVIITISSMFLGASLVFYWIEKKEGFFNSIPKNTFNGRRPPSRWLRRYQKRRA